MMLTIEFLIVIYYVIIAYLYIYVVTCINNYTKIYMRSTADAIRSGYQIFRYTNHVPGMQHHLNIPKLRL